MRGRAGGACRYGGGVSACLSDFATILVSPPCGLRNYNIPPSIWGGNPKCKHEWGSQERGRRGDLLPSEESTAQRVGMRNEQTGQNEGGRFCQLCPAWLGNLGLEPTPGLFVSHLVEVFRCVRRVLRKEGTVWLNLGDCFICEPHGAGHTFDPKYGGRNREEGYTANRAFKGDGFKSKDLVMIPARVAIALAEDGWYLRSQIPWVRSNAMPDSTIDRPGTAVEYIFQLAKQESYWYDREAVRLPQSVHERTRRLREQKQGLNTVYEILRDDEAHGQVKPGATSVTKSVKARAELAADGTRVRRNGDWAFESLRQGLYTDDDGEPLVMAVNPEAFPLRMCKACDAIYSITEYRQLELGPDGKKRICKCGLIEWMSHTATFPVKMVNPLVLAGTSAHGCCNHCGAPYERILQAGFYGDWHPDGARGHDKLNVNSTRDKTKAQRRWSKLKQTEAAITKPPNNGALTNDNYTPPKTIGWQPTCSHPFWPPEPVPCTVLDPFAGACSTGLAALAHGRNFVGIELSPKFILMAERRIREMLAKKEAHERNAKMATKAEDPAGDGATIRAEA